MTNKEKAIEIFRLLEENHINLYHDISKEEFEKYLNKFLEIANDLDEIHFDAEMSKLFSLFKDAHTTYQVNDKCVDPCIKCIEGKFYYYDIGKKLCEEIVEVNGVEITEVLNRFEKIIQYEVTPWLNEYQRLYLRAIKHLQMIKCENKQNSNEIEYKLKNGESVRKGISSKKKTNPPFYSFEELDNNILKIDYRLCCDIEGYPFKQFVKDIKKKYKKLPNACIVDMRNNTGGNDVIIFPLIDWLGKNNIKTYTLMGRRTFSSGVFGLIDLKHCVNATLIGIEAGQAAHNYGECRVLEVDGQQFTYCRKYFNQTTFDTKQNVKEFPVKKVINYLGPIKPDIFLEEKVEDVKNGIDGQLRDSLEIIKNDLQLNTEIIN